MEPLLETLEGAFVCVPISAYECLFQVGMNGDTFSIKAPKECSKKFAATFKGNSLPEEMFLEHYLCS